MTGTVARKREMQTRYIRHPQRWRVLNYKVAVYKIPINIVLLYVEISLPYSSIITKRPFRKAAEVIDGRISVVTFV